MNPFEIEAMSLEPYLPVMIKLPPSLLRAVDSQSKKELQNRSAWIRTAMLELLAQRKKEAKRNA